MCYQYFPIDYVQWLEAKWLTGHNEHYIYVIIRRGARTISEGLFPNQEDSGCKHLFQVLRRILNAIGRPKESLDPCAIRSSLPRVSRILSSANRLSFLLRRWKTAVTDVLPNDWQRNAITGLQLIDRLRLTAILPRNAHSTHWFYKATMTEPRWTVDTRLKATNEKHSESTCTSTVHPTERVVLLTQEADRTNALTIRISGKFDHRFSKQGSASSQTA